MVPLFLDMMENLSGLENVLCVLRRKLVTQSEAAEKVPPKGFSSPCIVSQPWRPSYQQSSVFGSSVYKYNFSTDVEKIINRAEKDKGLKRDI